VQPADFLIEHATVVATCAGPAPRRGRGQREITPLRGAVVAALNGEIVFVGPAGELASRIDVLPGATRIDAHGCTAIPGFIDPHTHIVYAGDRRGELHRRLAGATYEEIAAAGGGILSTVAATRAASDAELIGSAKERLDEMLACGTTTCEAKSGYGLTLESELKQLRVIRELDARHALDVIPTFLGAHDIPPEYRHDRDAYVRLVISEMIPAVAAEGLAAWCDVFCERGAFTPAESLAILEEADTLGLGTRIHANEFASSGGCEVAADVGAASADHLVYLAESDIDALARAGSVATLLPTAAFYLQLGTYAPARALIDRDIPIAIGTDINPGAGLSPSIPFAMALACFAMGMTLEEALIAATINAAHALQRSDSIGSLERGKLMDAVIVKGEPVDLLRVGTPAIRMVIKRGKVVHWAQT
jgi:imidazolonepropionase